MSNIGKIKWVLAGHGLAVILIVLSAPVSAKVWLPEEVLSSMNSSCPVAAEQYRKIDRLTQQIATAETVAKARTMALAPSESALYAVKKARIIMPFSEDLKVAETRLEHGRGRILLASSQQQAADEFSGMMLAGLDNDRAAHLSIGKVGCDYSTGEIIAIVVGLILGIIPGLILLIVLC